MTHSRFKFGSIQTSVLVCCIALLCCTGVFANDVWLSHVNVLDTDSGKARNDVHVRITDGLIAEVSKHLPAVDQQQTLDLTGKWIIPGLVDMHTHLGMAGRPGIASEWSNVYYALVAYRNAQSMLEHGFTTVRNLGTQGYATTDLARAINSGLLVGPTIIDAGKFIIPFGVAQSVTKGKSRHPIPIELGPIWENSYLMATGPWEMVEAVRQNIYYGAETIKIVADMNPYSFTEAELKAAIDEAHAAGKTVAVHFGYGGEPVRRAILAGADSIEHGFGLDEELLKLMKEHGTVLSTTDFPWELLRSMFSGNEEAAREWNDKFTQRLVMAHKMGVKMVFGTDAIHDIDGKSRGEMAIWFIDKWIEVGIPELDLLRAMTVSSYEFLGLSQQGKIEPGYAADLVILDQNPLENIQTLKQPFGVIKGGVRVARMQLAGDQGQ
ncbi:MAG: amidohydrolase family protein [Xanthomonadales bacterium]|nr:amidohydrolase family protein [Xanthomonadales bacterium]